MRSFTQNHTQYYTEIFSSTQNHIETLSSIQCHTEHAISHKTARYHIEILNFAQSHVIPHRNSYFYRKPHNITPKHLISHKTAQYHIKIYIKLQINMYVTTINALWYVLTWGCERSCACVMCVHVHAHMCMCAYKVFQNSDSTQCEDWLDQIEKSCIILSKLQ